MEEPALFGVPEPTARHPGWCRLPTRFGAERPCGHPAEGTVAEWTAPLDPAQRLGACQDCADTFGLELRPWPRGVTRSPGVRQDVGGEAVCYLHLVCPECGHLDDDRSGTTCRRCGAALRPDE